MSEESPEYEIIEGFLCPICMVDLKDARQLTNHFESNHQEEQDVLKSLKDFFSKAKKILNSDECELRESFDRTLQINADYSQEQIQSLGVTRSHTIYFKSVRTARLERYALETNKLLIRLDKLVSNMPSDSSQRKQYEQDIVPWLDGSSVKLCPSCAKSFNITRRQHHCRLCGCLICHDCSMFLDLEKARCIVDPSVSVACLSTESNLEKTGLRLCIHCYNLIELRRQVQESRNTKSILVTAYEQMMSLMEQAKPLEVMYEKMIESLLEGETTYNLKDANALRARIAKLAEGIDLLSKQICALPVNDAYCKQQKLQNAIKQAATQYIKENSLSLRKLPTEEQLSQVRRERYERAERQIEAERKRIQLHNERLLQSAEAGPSRNGPSSPAKRRNESDDSPLLEQMNIIRGYIKQARDDMKYEEVAILEANLKELKKEYQLQFL